jgi:hypothetical protein
VDTDLATSFLEELHERSPRHEFLSAWCVDHDTGRRSTLWSTVGDPATLVKEIDALPGRLSAYVGVATRKYPLPDGARGGIADCASVPALWVDIDVRGPNHVSVLLPPTLDAAYGLVDELGEEPSVVVETGGGLQAYWILEESAPCNDGLTRTLARWAAVWTDIAGGHQWRIDNVWDISRVLRLPGSMNNKQLNNPVPVVLGRA